MVGVSDSKHEVTGLISGTSTTENLLSGLGLEQSPPSYMAVATCLQNSECN